MNKDDHHESHDYLPPDENPEHGVNTEEEMDSAPLIEDSDD